MNRDIPPLSPQSVGMYPHVPSVIKLPWMYSFHKVGGDVPPAPSSYGYHRCTLSTKSVGMYPMHLLHTVTTDVLSPQSVGMYPMHLLHTVTTDVLSPQSQWGCIPCTFCIQLPWMYSFHKVGGDVPHAPFAYSCHGCTLSIKSVGMYSTHLLHSHHGCTLSTKPVGDVTHAPSVYCYHGCTLVCP